MTSDHGRIAFARKQARNLWISKGRPSPGELDLEQVAHHAGLRVVRSELEGATARLTYKNGSGFIRLSTNSTHRGRERFSIAHELGHAWLHKATMWCAEGDLEGLHSDAGKEAEANAFASELLMPTELLVRHLKGDYWTKASISSAATKFDVSFTAAALSLLSVTHEPCAVVMVRDGTVAWRRWNEDFWAQISAVPPSEFRQISRPLGYFYTEGRRREIEDWCARPRYPANQYLFEETIQIPSANAVLVLLTLVDE